MLKSIKNLKINLEADLFNSESTFIVAHNGIDLDGLGSAVGLATISEQQGVPAYIIIDESELIMDTLVKKIIKDKCGNFNFVNKEAALKLLTGNDMLILTDVSKLYRTCVADSVDLFNTVYVIDHHQEDSETFVTPNSTINSTASSASEIVTGLLRAFQINLDEDLATVLLAGINLDTNNYTKNRNASTLRCIANLMDRGGDDEYITQLFMGDFSETLKKYEIASRGNTEFRTFSKRTIVPIGDSDATDSFDINLSLALAVDENIRNRINLAQAANFLLEYSDVSITMAPIDDHCISVHGRSKGQVNIGEILTQIGGGGNQTAGAALLENTDLPKAKKKILTAFPPLSRPKKF